MARSDYFRSFRFRQLCRRSFAVLCGVAAAGLPLFAGPVGTGTLTVAYVPGSAHRAYALTMFTAGDAAAGRRWLSAGENALLEPREAELPFRSSIEVVRGEPLAVGLRFSGPTGRRIDVEVAATDSGGGDVFVELFDATDSRPALVRSIPATGAAGSRAYRFVREGLDEAKLLLRVQPDLDYAGTLQISLTESPLLGFPVSGHSLRSIQSGFGADRDAGRRAHRGVDIFAARGSEVVASLDSWVARVDTTPRGGNVVWLQPLYGNLRLYYAHLDTQLVSEGDFVFAGDLLGTVGNTGNAITTPPHLHYGVYLRRRGMRGGAQDPVDFLR